MPPSRKHRHRYNDVFAPPTRPQDEAAARLATGTDNRQETSEAEETKRRRWESNPRWQICNPEPEPVSPGNGSDSEEVPTKVPTPGGADGDLPVVVEAWPSLPAAVRAGILAMVKAIPK